MRILYLTPPAKTSNELDTYRRIPDCEVLAVDADQFRRGAEMTLPTASVPWLGAPERWTAALAWYRGLPEVAPGPIDAVLSAELFSQSTFQAIRLAKRLGAVHVTVVAEVLPRSPLNWLPPWALFRRHNASRTDAVVALSHAAATYARRSKVRSGKVDVVYPGVDVGRYVPAGGLRSEPRVVFVGELRPDKGVLDAIAACDLVAAEAGEGFALVVAGDGPLRDDVALLANDRPWLEVLGQVPRDDIPALLRESRAALIPPWSRPLWAEQFGYALVEAMACGLPVVTTRCGALSEVVPTHNPIVGERDVAALAEGLRRVLGPEGARVGAANRAAVGRRFDLDVQATRLGDVLRAVASRREHR